ncbi:uncharacterized protein LOC132315599 isoform X2 [Cornus florida]|uniref:uncharacterized protein LOC132315599 isoform X2 n=1 Tax=Cornus florida TaxID=4283 RepID=UPI0028A1B2B7|nr:uncharacterized protein LOC132315599 isoform X2 [Cornus florida]
MATDQRKKRLNAAIIGSSQEHCRAKRKKPGLVQYGLNMIPNISLEWDDKKKNVVAKREQIGLTRRDLIPSIDYVPHWHNNLADVSTVPYEIFDLENLKEVLSYEVWQTHLSGNERNFLSQFLPKGDEAHQVVKELLAGNNFHFGNPFLKWGASLCSGNLHPDAVLHQEQCLKANKKAYYLELQKYHNDMIGNLLTWKETWSSVKDPEKEIVQKTWRARKHAENEYRFHDSEENLAATSESCSWTDEKACSSDNQNIVMKDGELQRRKNSMEKYENSSDGLKVVARPRKGEKLHKQNIYCSDGAKYMSYIKISKEQHQRVKSSMKHSSNSIQSRSLNRVLGNLDTFHVQPYEVFEEEERQNLHDHWLRLANTDLPAAFVNWRRRQLQKWQLMQSLEQDMEDKLKFVKEDAEKENTHSLLSEPTDDGSADHETTNTTEGEGRENSDSLLQEMDNGANHEPTTALEDEEKKNLGGILQEQMYNRAPNHEPSIEDAHESVHVSSENQHVQQLTSLSGTSELHPVHLNSDEDHLIAETDKVPPIVSEYPKNLNHLEVAVSQGDPLSSATDVWPAVGVPNSYFHSTSVNRDYTSPSDLSVGHPQVLEEQPARLIDLESNIHEEDTQKNMLHRHSNDQSFVSPYPNQDRNELLQHYFNGRGGLSYHHERKQTRLDFQPTANVSMEAGQSSGHFQEQLHPSLPLEVRQKRLTDLYTRQNIQENVYSDGGRYSFPRQEHFLPVNIQDWAVNTPSMSAPLRSHLNGGELGENWFSGEHRARAGWPGLDGAVGPSQSIGSRNNADQSLFSVLSHCNELHSAVPFDSMGSTEQFIQSANYGGVGGGVPIPGNLLQQTAHPLNYLSGQEASAAVKNNNIGWMNLPNQTSALQDAMGKPFLRSWNH